MKKHNWFTIFVGNESFISPQWVKIAEISSEGLVNLLFPRLAEIYVNQPIRVIPGKHAAAPFDIDLYGWKA
jgi:hypothetical protein